MNSRLASLSVCILALTVGPSFAQDYVGSTTCKGCHNGMNPDLVANHEASGHPYKLNLINGSAPTYPAHTSPGVQLPEGKEWSDFIAVIGGYGWKARFIQPDGRIFTATDSAQYNLADGSYAAYHFGETDKRYNQGCFQCHTTGAVTEGSWPEEFAPGQAADVAPDLGTFSEPGIRCEGCHGPGSLHRADPSGVAVPNAPGTEALNFDVCGTCHQRGGLSNQIPASGGYIRHHEQGNEMMASRHRDGVGADLTCSSCHDSHVPLRYPEAAVSGYEAITTTCDNGACHGGGYEVLFNGVNKGIECVDCHMPKASKSALKTEIGSGFQGDVATHIMAINTNPVGRDAMFTSEGGLVALDGDGLASVTVDFACLACHTNQSVAWASEYASGIHRNGLNIVPQAFAVEVTASNASSSLSLTLGLAELATDGFDEGLDLLAPPPPPTGAFDARLRNNGEDYLRDLRGLDSAGATWQVVVQGDVPINLSWNPDQFPDEGRLWLDDGLGGVVLSIDMTTVSSVELPSALNSIYITHSLAPTAAADEAETPEDEARVIDVLSNDTDANGDKLSISAVSEAQHGSVTINPDSTLTYTPAADYHGTDTFTYTASDGALTAVGTVSIVVTSVNDLPTFGDDGAFVSPGDGETVFVGGDSESSAVDPGTAVVFDFREATDVDGDALTYTWSVATDAEFTNLVTGIPPLDGTSVSFTVSDLAQIVDGAGAELGVGLTLYHRVTVEDGVGDPVEASATAIFVRGYVTGLYAEGEVPETFALHGNYPNPFNPTTQIRFDLPIATDVRLEVFDVLGRRVAILVNGHTAAGFHEIAFDAQRLPSGLYVYTIKADGFAATRTMVLTK